MDQQDQDKEQEVQRESEPREGGRLQVLVGYLQQVAGRCWAILRSCVRGLRGLTVRAWSHESSQRSRLRLRVVMGAITAQLRSRAPLARRIAHFGLRAAVLMVAVGLGTFLLGRFTLRSVDPGEVGVRFSKWDGEGVIAEDFGPGLHLSLPGVHSWYFLPVGTELLTWRAGAGGESGSQLDVRTLDGTSISLNLTVPYRIVRGEAHSIVSEGHRNTYRQQALAKAEQVLINEFGRLNTEQFSSSKLRRELLDDSLALLNESLEEIHVVAEEILIDELRFSEGYEKKLVETQRERQRGRVLEARQLEDQEQQTILRRRHEIDQELLKRRIELDLEIEGVRGEGQALAVERVRSVEKFDSDLRADADREYELLVGAGENALRGAKDLDHHLRAEILSGAGGDQFLALQAARATDLKEVVLNSNDPRVPNPLDVDSMMGLFSSSD